MWLVEGHFHLHDLKFRSLEIRNGHAEDLIPVKIQWDKSPESPWRWKFTIETENEEFHTSSIHFNEDGAHGLFKAPPRGKFSVRYLRVESDRPHGLYRTWIFFKAQSDFLSYPALIKIDKVELSGFGGEGEVTSEKKGNDEFKSLSPYQGEESRKISWKHYARAGELVVKEGEEHLSSIVKFELNLPENSKLKEAYLSQLASEMVTCHRKMIPFSFKAGSYFKQASLDNLHLNECLTFLALC